MSSEGKSTVFAFHYSSRTPFRGFIEFEKCDVVTVRFPNTSSRNYFCTGEPIVLSIKRGTGEFCIQGGKIENISENDMLINVKTDRSDKNVENRRLYNRLPVSYYADVKELDSNRRHSSVVKDVSKNGLLVYCKNPLPVQCKAKLNIFLEGTILFIEAEVVRVFKDDEFHGHGMTIPALDHVSRKSLHKCLRSAYEGYNRTLQADSEFSIEFDELDFPINQYQDKIEQMLSNSARKLDEILRRSRY